MKAQDLRIGNSVLKNGIPTTLNVELFLELLKCSTPFEPIPITEEWLFKFGFVDSSKTIGNFYFSITLGSNEAYINDGDGYEGACVLSKVKYVHQLQNLYFALTGEELTLSE